jgi:hypothetical protein
MRRQRTLLGDRQRQDLLVDSAIASSSGTGVIAQGRRLSANLPACLQLPMCRQAGKQAQEEGGGLGMEYCTHIHYTAVVPYVWG